MSDLPRVTVWNEYRQEKTDEPVRQLYPEGMHAPIAKYLEAEGIPVRIATLDEPEHGLTEEQALELLFPPIDEDDFDMVLPEPRASWE